MTLYSLESAQSDRLRMDVPWLALGFRPFFLAAGIAAVALLTLWILDYSGWLALSTYYPAVTWHGHEMIFGYTVAVIAGFLLTAVRNWTNLPTPRGLALGGLVVLWLAGRVVPFLATLLPAPIIAVVDLAFLPVLAIALAVPLLRRRQQRNLIFVPILAALFVANLLVHLQVLGYTDDTATRGLYLGVHLIILIIAVIGGRVIPFFTERALPGAKPRTWRAVELLAPASIVVFAIFNLLGIATYASAAVALLAAVTHAARLAGWYDKRIWRVPLLWILHVGYGWVAVGFALHAAAALGWLPVRVGLHGFTAGAIGMLTIGMMARVSLGHTGRRLEPAAAMSMAFAATGLGALVRVLGAAAAPDEWYVAVMAVAALLWAAGFATFVAVYAPLLTRPRPDGEPG